MRTGCCVADKSRNVLNQPEFLGICANAKTPNKLDIILSNMLDGT